jgi:Flp pilus assembly protein TadD
MKHATVGASLGGKWRSVIILLLAWGLVSRVLARVPDEPPDDPAKIEAWAQAKIAEAKADADAATAEAQAELNQPRPTADVPASEPVTDDEPYFALPEANPALKAYIQSRSFTDQSLPVELASIAQTINAALDPDKRGEVERLIQAYSGQSVALANAAAIAWVQRAPEQALGLAAAAAQADPTDANAVNTLGALLAEAGYEQKGIPLLAHVEKKYPTDPTVLSNLGVAWLNLGELDEANRYLFRVFAVASGHGPAHAAAGVIAEHRGAHAEAMDHFRRAAASNSSPLARRALRHHHESFRAPKGFLRMVKTKEYFSPSGYAPLGRQENLAGYYAKKADLEIANRTLREELKKRQHEAVDSLAQATKHLMQDGPGAGVYANLDWNNFNRAAEEELAEIFKLKNQRSLRLLQLRQSFGQRAPPYAANGTPHDLPADPYAKLIPVATEYLGLMSNEYDKMVQETLYRYRALVNRRLTYLPLQFPDPLYRSAFEGTAGEYIGFVALLNDELPLVSEPCSPESLVKGKKPDLEEVGPGSCPFSLEVEVVVATLHMDCKKFGFDFKAGLAFSASKDFSTGETTLTAGVGAKANFHGVANAGVSGQFVMTWDHDNALSFVGVEATAGANVSGIPGLSGALDAGALGLGGEGTSVALEGDSLSEDILKAGADVKLGVAVGPRGVESSLSGEASGEALGHEIFKIEIPELK